MMERLLEMIPTKTEVYTIKNEQFSLKIVNKSGKRIFQNRGYMIRASIDDFDPRDYIVMGKDGLMNLVYNAVFDEYKELEWPEDVWFDYVSTQEHSIVIYSIQRNYSYELFETPLVWKYDEDISYMEDKPYLYTIWAKLFIKHIPTNKEIEQCKSKGINPFADDAFPYTVKEVKIKLIASSKKNIEGQFIRSLADIVPIQEVRMIRFNRFGLSSLSIKVN